MRALSRHAALSTPTDSSCAAAAGVQRPREQEALRVLALELAQQVELPLGLDALGDDAHAELVGEADDRAHDLQRARGRVPIESTNERSILSASPGKPRRTVSDAAPVPKSSRCARTPVSREQALERRAHRVGVGGRRGLGDLEPQRLGLDAVVGQRRGDVAGEGGLEQLAARRC